MALTTVEALAGPSPAWWQHLWPTAWALPAAAFAAWLTCRAVEKRTPLRAADEDDTTPGSGTSGTGPAYDQAA